jgi:glutamine cyclotransferase
MVGARPPPVLAQQGSQTFSATGKTVSGQFLDYWSNHGGLTQQGYPISDQMQEASDTDGKTYTVQYFERAVFEQQPENQPPNDVLLSLLGTFLYKQKYPNGAPNQTPNNSAGSQLFAATGHRVGGKFLDYWNQHGGLAQEGYPISDEFQEVSDLDGKTYTVQYFERAVFESHPENQPPYDVLLSQLGTFRYKAKYLVPAPTATVAAPPAPTAGPTAPAAPVGTVAVTIKLVIHDTESVAYGAGSLWVGGFRSGAVVRVDPQSGAVMNTINFGAGNLCATIQATDSAIWVLVVKGEDPTAPESLARIDPATNQVVQTFDAGNGVSQFAITGDTLWTMSDIDGTVKRIDPKTQKVTATISVETPSPDINDFSDIIYSNGQIWVTAPAEKSLVHIDPNSNKIVERFQIGTGGEYISPLDNSLWISSTGSGKVIRFDLAAKKVVASIDVTGYPSGLLATQHGVWVSQAYFGQVTRINPATNQAVGSLTVASGGAQYPQQIVEVNGALWVVATDQQGHNILVKFIPAP